eukprot:m.676433 g.676433  ORF g.676433 m.676433 type:complete len:592 (+) comp22790_c1_seq10:127-1902(+)
MFPVVVDILITGLLVLGLILSARRAIDQNFNGAEYRFVAEKSNDIIDNRTLRVTGGTGPIHKEKYAIGKQDIHHSVQHQNRSPLRASVGDEKTPDDRQSVLASGGHFPVPERSPHKDRQKVNLRKYFADQDSQASTSTFSYERLGCMVVDTQWSRHIRDEKSPPAGSDAMCATECGSAGYIYFGRRLDTVCWCTDDFVRDVSNRKLSMNKCNGAVMNAQMSGVYRITSKIPTNVITLYIHREKRLLGFFTSGRLQKYLSSEYAIRRRYFPDLHNDDPGVEFCIVSPGKKIILTHVGNIENVLQHWPDNAIVMLTGDEIGTWGLTQLNGIAIGPHGKDKNGVYTKFKSNETSTFGEILLPPEIFPLYRQYFHYRQVGAFGDRVRFFPLGSRYEFPDIREDKIVLASSRKYIYNLMVSETDPSRKQARDVLDADIRIPRNQRYIHVSEHWHSSANNPDYVHPRDYQAIMLQSAFTICPKGHSYEQFRFYEAIESGSIPVIETGAGAAKKHLPPQFFESPMVFVDSWTQASQVMLALWQNRTALCFRQQRLRKWFAGYMRNLVHDIEGVLESRASLNPGPFCVHVNKSLSAPAR